MFSMQININGYMYSLSCQPSTQNNIWKHLKVILPMKQEEIVATVKGHS